MSKQDIARKIGELESQLEEEKKKLEAVSGKSIIDMLVSKRAEMSFQDFWWKFFWSFTDMSDFTQGCIHRYGTTYPEKLKFSDVFAEIMRGELIDDSFDFFDVGGSGQEVLDFLVKNDVDVSTLEELEYIDAGGCMQTNYHLLLFDGNDVYTFYSYSNSWEGGACDEIRKVSEVKEKREWVVCH